MTVCLIAHPTAYGTPIRSSSEHRDTRLFLLDEGKQKPALLWASKAALDAQVGEQRQFRQAGPGILTADYRLDVNISQSSQVGKEVLTALQNLKDAGRQVREQSNPTDSLGAATIRDAFPGLVGEQQVRKVYARSPPQRMVAPGATVEIEQLVRSVAWVQFVFQLYQTVIVDCPQEALGQFLKDG